MGDVERIRPTKQATAAYRHLRWPRALRRALIRTWAGSGTQLSNKQGLIPSRSHPIVGHGSLDLPRVTIDRYGEELRDGDGLIGDRASNRAFREIFAKWRERLRKAGRDPIGDLEKIKKGQYKTGKLGGCTAPIPAGRWSSASRTRTA